MSNGARYRILVVDDDPLVARAIRRTLGQNDVTVCGSGEEALGALRLSRSYDLVLCDVQMPGMGGLEVWQEAKVLDAAVAARFVFMTGGAFSPSAEEMLARAKVPTLDKPFGREAIAAVLERVPPLAA